MFIKYSIVDLISSFFDNSFEIMNCFPFEIDELNVKKLYFEFNDDLRYRITFLIFIVNSLMKTLNEN